MSRYAFLVLSSWLALAGAQAQTLSVEIIDLGDLGSSGLQAYNLQERGDTRVFARSAAGFKDSQIYTQKRDGERWRAAEPLPFADPRWRDSDPHLSADGKTLSFVSDRPTQGAGAALGQLDLYEVSLVDGRWAGPPTRLAEAWQSPAYELGPERYGERLYFASYRAGGPAKLSVYAVESGSAAPVALPAPINEGELNSDFSLTPDGRHALWWSRRAGSEGGDLYLAERVGAGFGPALRLPAPINGPDFEFTPSVSADGQWLLFASTRPLAGGAPGLAHMYRVSWPAVLAALGPAAQAHSQAALDAQVGALWRAFGHGADQGADVARMSALLHPQAMVFGQTLRAASTGARAWSAAEFLALLKPRPGPAMHECEIHREQRRYGAHAQVYSVVETRRDPAQARPDYSGVNSMQWQLGPEGWQLLSLHYALELPGLALPATERRSGQCLG